MSLTSSTSPICTPKQAVTHLIIMGVSGCGKTTLGEGLAKALVGHFIRAKPTAFALLG